MSALKIFGGLIALVAGILVLLPTLDLLGVTTISMPYILGYYLYMWAYSNTFVWINMILVIVVILGGLIGIAGKKAGAVLVLAAAILWIIGGFANALSGMENFLAISFYTAMTGDNLIGAPDGFVTLEAILALVGGLCILAGRSNKSA